MLIYAGMGAPQLSLSSEKANIGILRLKCKPLANGRGTHGAVVGTGQKRNTV